jgi:hypothetical protein
MRLPSTKSAEVGLCQFFFLSKENVAPWGQSGGGFLLFGNRLDMRTVCNLKAPMHDKMLTFSIKAIFALNLVGVHDSAVKEWGRPIADNELPALRRPSDIMMAYWLRDNTNPKNLKYYIAMNVVNFQTLPVINRVLRDNGQTRIPYWPGLTVGLFHPHGQALLGEYSISHGDKQTRLTYHRNSNRCHRCLSTFPT